MDFFLEEWKRQQGREIRERERKETAKRKLKNLNPRTMPQVTVPGMYWFTDIDDKKWFVQIYDPNRLDPKQATMLEVGKTIINEVDSIGVGEFVGPITSLSGYR